MIGADFRCFEKNRTPSPHPGRASMAGRGVAALLSSSCISVLRPLRSSSDGGRSQRAAAPGGSDEPRPSGVRSNMFQSGSSRSLWRYCWPSSGGTYRSSQPQNCRITSQPSGLLSSEQYRPRSPASRPVDDQLQKTPTARAFWWVCQSFPRFGVRACLHWPTDPNNVAGFQCSERN